MKYWKGKVNTTKDKMYGTMDNNGYVPDSIEIDKQEYNQYIESLPAPEPVPESDINKLIQYAKKQGWI